MVQSRPLEHVVLGLTTRQGSDPYDPTLATFPLSTLQALNPKEAPKGGNEQPKGRDEAPKRGVV